MSWLIEIFSDDSQYVYTLQMERRERVWCTDPQTRTRTGKRTKRQEKREKRLKITLLMAPHTDTTSKLYGWITRFQLYTNLFRRRHFFRSLNILIRSERIVSFNMLLNRFYSTHILNKLNIYVYANHWPT